MYVIHCQLVTVAIGILFFLITHFPLWHLLHLNLVISISDEFQTSPFPGCFPFVDVVLIFVCCCCFLFVVVFWLQLFLSVHFAHAYGLFFSLHNFAPDGSSTVFYSFTCTYNHKISCMDIMLILDVWAMLAWLFWFFVLHDMFGWLWCASTFQAGQLVRAFWRNK